MKFAIRPAARQDILDHFTYLVDEGVPRVAERFIDAVEETVSKLTHRPQIGSPRNFKNPKLEGLRNWPVKGFHSVRIYYLVSENTIRVIRVLHGKRNVRTILRRERES